MRPARVIRAACLTLGLILAAVSCSGLERDAGRDGVRGGTLRVLNTEPDVPLDTAYTYGPIVRAYARTLYGYNLAGPPSQATVPVPDIASSYQLSADRRTYTFTLRPGIRYAPPVNREVTARDFITAIQRLYADKDSPPYWQQYADLIAGAAAFGVGKASRISGLTPPTPALSPSPWPSRPVTSCPSWPCRALPRCQGSTRPATRLGPTTAGTWSALVPTP